MSSVYTIYSNQTSIHPKLSHAVEKHIHASFAKPIHSRDRDTFHHLRSLMSDESKLILDSGCGTGMSTLLLSKQYPDHYVIGVDKSIYRLSKNMAEKRQDNHVTRHSDRCFLVQADLINFWRLCCEESLVFDYHTLFYPNPWPKSKHLMRRFHAHPVFPSLICISDSLSIRSNWQLYLQEFQLALRLYGHKSTLDIISPEQEPMTLFEKKYFKAREPVFSLYCNVNGD